MRERTRDGDRSRLSRSMEDYLRAIDRLTEQGTVVTTKALAAQLGVAPPSVTDMIKRLADRGLVDHHPYRSITLTASGAAIGRRLSRRYRLLQYYLVKTLGYSWEDVAAEADRLEHTLSVRLEERIAGQLEESRDGGDHGMPSTPLPSMR